MLGGLLKGIKMTHKIILMLATAASSEDQSTASPADKNKRTNKVAETRAHTVGPACAQCRDSGYPRKPFCYRQLTTIYSIVLS